MINVVIIDTETTGLNPNSDRIIEIAAILFNVKTKSIIQCFSTLLPCEENNAFHINGISAEATRAAKASRESCMPMLLEMVSVSDAIVAHNAKFDVGFLKRYMPSILVAPVICTKDDFKWPMILYRHRLQDVCEALGVSYSQAHRALTDCHLLAECFKQVEDLDRRLDQALKFKKENAYASFERVNDSCNTVL